MPKAKKTSDSSKVNLQRDSSSQRSVAEDEEPPPPPPSPPPQWTAAGAVPNQSSHRTSKPYPSVNYSGLLVYDAEAQRPPPVAAVDKAKEDIIIGYREGRDLFKDVILKNEPAFCSELKRQSSLKRFSGSGGGSKGNTLQIPHLNFGSNFESGNLRYAYRLGDSCEYHLYLKSDDGPRVNTLWYYFSVAGMLPGVTYKFSIVNLVKKGSLYKKGLQPLIRSKTEHGGRWQRLGNEIAYYRTRNQTLVQHIKSTYSGKQAQNVKHRRFYTLTFKMTFNAASTYYMAYCFPFTYSQCCDHLQSLADAHDPQQYVLHRTMLCPSVLGNRCDILTVTDHTPIENKLGIVVTCRVHPGETSSSWVCKGILDTLCHPTLPLAKELRNKFVFKIVPMLNPDGVYRGTYRSAPTAPPSKTGEILHAVDLNRRWHAATPSEHPTIYYAKETIAEFSKEMPVAMHVDLHGHSEATDCFVFGFYDNESMSRWHVTRFPSKWSQCIAEHGQGQGVFSAAGSSYYSWKQIPQCRGVGPLVVFREIGIPCCYTIEHSMGLTSRGYQFTQEDYMKVGFVFCESVLSCFAQPTSPPAEKAKSDSSTPSSDDAKLEPEAAFKQAATVAALSDRKPWVPADPSECGIKPRLRTPVTQHTWNDADELEAVDDEIFDDQEEEEELDNEDEDEDEDEDIVDGFDEQFTDQSLEEADAPFGKSHLRVTREEASIFRECHGAPPVTGLRLRRQRHSKRGESQSIVHVASSELSDALTSELEHLSDDAHGNTEQPQVDRDMKQLSLTFEAGSNVTDTLVANNGSTAVAGKAKQFMAKVTELEEEELDFSEFAAAHPLTAQLFAEPKSLSSSPFTKPLSTASETVELDEEAENRASMWDEIKNAI